MDCNAIQKHFSEYIDDRLEENLTAVVEEHLETCPTCKGELEALKMVVSRVSGLAQARAPKDFVSHLNRRLEPSVGFKKVLQFLSVPGRFKIPFGFATATAVAVAIIFMIQIKQPHQSITPHQGEIPPVEKMERFSAPERKRPVVPDASDTAQRPAASPIPKEKEVENIIHWELVVDPALDKDPSEPSTVEPKKAEEPLLSAREAGLMVTQQEESVDRMEKEGLGTDEVAKRQHGPMKGAFKQVEALTKDLGGAIISVEQRGSPNFEEMVILSIPAQKVKKLYTALGRIGRFDGPPEEVPEYSKKPVKIHLKLISK